MNTTESNPRKNIFAVGNDVQPYLNTLPTNERNNKHLSLKHILGYTALGLTVLWFGVADYHKTIDALKPEYKKYDGINFEVLVDLTNSERIESGLKPLTIDPKLNLSAEAKCKDMVTKDYWSHYAPDGTAPWKFMDDQHIHYGYAGENLARGYTTEEDVNTGWMESPSHKANILTPGYTHIGFGACTSSDYIGLGTSVIIVEHFDSLDKPPVVAGHPANYHK